MKKEIAIFQNKYGFTTYDKEMEKYTDSVRITEYVEIDFPELSLEIVVGHKVVIIDRQIDEIKNKAMEEVSNLKTRKAELLALTHEVAE